MRESSKSLIGYIPNVSWNGAQARGVLVCSCGCDRFSLFRRAKTAEEELEELLASNRLRDDYWPFGPEIAKDKSGKAVVRNAFLCFRWKERPYSDYLPSVLSFQYVSAKCERCGRQIVLYDGRLQQSDVDGMPPKYGEFGVVKWSKVFSMVECVFDCDGEEQSIGKPGRIRIYRIEDRKRSIFFDCETD